MIRMAKLYTSRFSNKELETGKYTVVGVVRSMPKFPVKYRIAGDIIQIAPPGYLWNENKSFFSILILNYQKIIIVIHCSIFANTVLEIL